MDKGGRLHFCSLLKGALIQKRLESLAYGYYLSGHMVFISAHYLPITAQMTLFHFLLYSSGLGYIIHFGFY